MTMRNYSLMKCYIPTAFLLLLSALFAPHSGCMPTAPPPTENITITVPKGSRLQGSDLQVLCTPSKWTDVAKFLLANYVAHAVTVKSVPGESFISVLKSIACSLLFPVSGVRRGVNAIYQRAILAKTPLEAAARAGALCMVVRSPEWRPERDDVVRILGVSGPLGNPWLLEQINSRSRAKRVIAGSLLRLAKAMRLLGGFTPFFFTSTTEDDLVSDIPAYVVVPYRAKGRLISPTSAFQPWSSSRNRVSRTVHGVCQLPSGYALCVVPPRTQVVELDEDQQGGGAQLDNNKLRRKDKTGHKEKGKTRDQDGGRATAISLYSRFKTQTSSRWASRRSSLKTRHSTGTQLSSVNNLAKGMIAVFQTIYASFTLYNVRGDQIQNYGYTAFGLTVVPYICMSTINLASTLLTPDYPTMYLVESEAMEEAKKRQGAKFEGVVGRIRTTSTSDKLSKTVKFDFNSDDKIVVLASNSDNDFTVFDKEAEMYVGKIKTNPFLPDAYLLFRRTYRMKPPRRPFRMIPQSSDLPPTRSRQDVLLFNLVICASWALATIPLAVNGALSYFKPRQSTRAQRVWTMAWLALGTISNNVNDIKVLALIFYSVPAIGGLVVVSQMIMQYGSCDKLSQRGL